MTSPHRRPGRSRSEIQRTTITTRIRLDLREKLLAAAHSQNKSMAEILDEALESFFAKKGNDE